MTPKLGPCTSDLLKGGIHICSRLMCTRWRVFLCVHVMIRMHVSSMSRGRIHWEYFSRKHMFSADTAGERDDRAELNNCTEETQRKQVCCCPWASEALFGVGSAGQRRFYLSDVKAASKGPVLIVVSVWTGVCVLQVKSWLGSFVRMNNEQKEQ